MEYLQLHAALNKQDDLYRVGRDDYEIMLTIMTQLSDCVSRIRQEVKAPSLNSSSLKPIVHRKRTIKA